MTLGTAAPEGTNAPTQDAATGPLQLDAAELAGLLKRLKRAQGQIGGVIRMVEEGRNCDQIVTQLAAASKALDRAGFAVVASSLRQCLAKDPDRQGGNTASLEKLFLTLA